VSEQKILTSIKNPLVKQVRKLHNSKERQQQNLLLLEGNNIISTAVNLCYPLHTVFCTLKWQERHQQLWQKIALIECQKQIVSPEVLSAMATTVNPDGVVAIAQRQAAQQPIVEQTKLGLIIERLQDPGNLGTIIRTAVATGIDSLWLSQDSVDFAHPKVLRASVGEWFRLPIGISLDLVTLVKQHQKQGIQIIATVPQTKKTYWELNLTRPSLFLIGNEGAGLSTELTALADEKVSIPLANGVESLNAAIATSLLLYEARRQGL
jgi:RNA methyltransferase, TrmH family